jgi:hypothetical protein
MKWHVGRSWSGSFLEDSCPCKQESCGLIAQEDADPDCIEHGINHTPKTMRQAHFSDECPGADGSVRR